MPRDSKGNFHMNTQRSLAADKMPSKPKPAGALGSAMKRHGAGEGGPPMETEHPPGSAGSPVHEHLAAMHEEMGGKHMHMHHDGMGGPHITHHVGHDGMVQGPHEHASADEAANHARQFFGEDETGGESDGSGDGGADAY